MKIIEFFFIEFRAIRYDEIIFKKRWTNLEQEKSQTFFHWDASFSGHKIIFSFFHFFVSFQWFFENSFSTIFLCFWETSNLNLLLLLIAFFWWFFSHEFLFRLEFTFFSIKMIKNTFHKQWVCFSLWMNIFSSTSHN